MVGIRLSSVHAHLKDVYLVGPLLIDIFPRKLYTVMDAEVSTKDEGRLNVTAPNVIEGSFKLANSLQAVGLYSLNESRLVRRVILIDGASSPTEFGRFRHENGLWLYN